MPSTKQTPLNREPELIAQNTAALILSLMRPKDQIRAAEIAAETIAKVAAAWAQLVDTEPQASSWSPNSRYLRTRAILVQQKRDVSNWSTEYEIVRYLVWALAPAERVERGTNLLHEPKAALKTKLATYLAERGAPKAGDSVYGWQDSDKQFHTRVCPIVHVAEVHEDSWDEFQDTFSPNSTQHGLTGIGTCRCGYVDGELRVQADLGEMLNELLRTEG